MTTTATLPPDVTNALRPRVGPAPTATLITDSSRVPVWRITGGDTVLAVKVGLGTRIVDREAAALEALHAVDLVRERPWHGEHSTGSWLATPWYQGATTEQHWASLRVRGAERGIMRLRALGWAVELAGAVADLHAKRWIHADLHPAQCIHTPAGARLIDYASAHGPLGAIPADLLAAYPYTTCRVDCAAPEIASAVLARRRPTATRAADVYALAATLRMSWTGEPAVAVRKGYGGRPPTPAQRRQAIADGAPLSRVPSPLAWPALEQILTPALSIDPLDRPTAAQLHTRLADLHRAATRAAHRSTPSATTTDTGDAVATSPTQAER
ncbi:hypothetical protein ACIRL2_46865 [Embleya sp. NPDC127516]|uniref:hypothetical protein n=1 Tax=Embleya sp. NPDC127516 TaxID=3363990 RepID=UPI0038275932